MNSVNAPGEVRPGRRAVTAGARFSVLVDMFTLRLSVEPAMPKLREPGSLQQGKAAFDNDMLF
jgi:hypothetical protein